MTDQRLDDAQSVGRMWKKRAEQAELALQAIVDGWHSRHGPLGDTKLEATIQAAGAWLESQR